MPSQPHPEEEAASAIQTTHPSPSITLITISRPHVRNAINAPTARHLYTALATFDKDPTQKVAILTGSNNTFCSGFDLHTVNNNPSSSNDTNSTSPPPHYSLSPPIILNTPAPMGPSRLQLSKPLIAAISGHAVAGGLELALLADLRVASSDAIFGVFCRRWGVPLIDGGTVRLQRIIGLGRALDLILTGRAVGAKEALGMGLVSRVIEKGKGDVVEEAVKLARSLVEFPQLCMNLDRASCYFAAYDAKSFEEAMRYEVVKGVEAVRAEGADGARRFSKEKVGRGGVFPGKL